MSSKIILILAILALSIEGAEAATITVGPEGCDYVSIQAAIDAASPGDFLAVAGGVYDENLVVDRSLVLRAGDFTDRPIVDAGGRGSAVTILADGVRLEGFVLENGGFGRAGIEVRSKYNQIMGNLVTDNRWYGIFLDEADGSVIEENVVWKNKYGIWINAGSDDNRINRNVLQDNENYNAFDLGTNLWEENFYGDYDGARPVYEVAGISSIDHSPSGPEREPAVEEPTAGAGNVTEEDRHREEEKELEEDAAARKLNFSDSGLNDDSDSAAESGAGEQDLNLTGISSESWSAEGSISSNRTLNASTFEEPKDRPRISIIHLSSLLDAPSEEQEVENGTTPGVGDAAADAELDEGEANESADEEPSVEEPSAVEPQAAAPAVEEYAAEDWTRSGDSHCRSGRYSDAIGCYDKAIEMDPELADAWDGKGDALMMTGRYDGALRCYERALEIDPGSAEIWYHKGNALQMLLRFEEALVCYDEALTIDPQFAEAWNRKGMTLNRLGCYQEALTCFEEAIEIEPGFAAAWSNKSWSLQMLGDDEGAKEAFDQARALGYG